MRINIFGASGSGVTTLGNVLSQRLNYPYFDSDDYFWMPSDPPFTQKREREVRSQLINDDLARHQNWILGGSVTNWGQEWPFDFVVFLLIPRDIRLKRIAKREQERYGDVIFTDKERNRLHTGFINWAAGYDEGTVSGRTLQAHEDWMQTLKCPLLKITGDTSVEERVEKVANFMNQLSRCSPPAFLD